MRVRFDALDGRGRSWEFVDGCGEIRAEGPEEVIPCLREIERAVADGLHAAGYIAYEAAPAFDPALAVRDSRPGLPLLWFGLFRSRHTPAPMAELSRGQCELGDWRESLDPDRYYAQVASVREYIAAGDSYQVNLTGRLRAAFRGSDLALYHQLCRSQRAGYCAYLRFDRFSVLSASPELFFRWAGDDLELRPMKGTRPRGRWPEEDRSLAAELLASPKDRAENLMIVDLLRNDAGRISCFGSVHVPRLFEVERYPTVHQLTSTIRSRTLPGTTLTDLLRALFPCGSVTGAPKVRTTEIIAELEDSPRGVYTGAIGFVSPGEAVFNVPIRTLLLDHAQGVAELGVGSGITYDSEAEAEYRECMQKAAFVRYPAAEFELLETMRYDPGTGIFLLEEHLARLAGSAEHLGFGIDLNAVRRELRVATEDLETGSHKIRLLLGRAGEIRVERAPLGRTPARLRARIAEEAVHSGDPLLFHKTTLRATYTSRAAAHPDCDEVLLINERGELTEFTTGNLVVRRGGESWTPPVDSGLLPGTFRAALLERGEIRERPLRPGDLHGADAVYLINSVREWIPVTVT